MSLRPGSPWWRETFEPPHPCGVRNAILRIAESAKATSELGDAAAMKYLMHPLFNGCAKWPKHEKGKSKKRKAGVSAASVATALDLGDKENGAPPAERPISSKSSLVYTPRLQRK
jgi:hypothetical protein